MKMTKIAVIALTACTVTFLNSACGLFEGYGESEYGEYQIDDSTLGGGTGENGKDIGCYGDDGIDLAGIGIGSDLGNGNGGPGAYGDDVLGGDYVDGFGPRVPNTEFEAVYFSFDQNTIPYSERFKVENVASYLKSHADQGIVVEGNCDERGTGEYNRALGEKRAISVKAELMALGIAETRIKTLSWGEDKPAVQGTTEEAYRLNRRAEFVPVYLKR